MLTVDLHQQMSQLRQLRYRDRRTINPCAGAATGLDGSTQQHLLTLLQFLLLQPLPGGGIFAYGKFGGEFGPVRTAADPAGV